MGHGAKQAQPGSSTSIGGLTGPLHEICALATLGTPDSAEYSVALREVRLYTRAGESWCLRILRLAQLTER